VSYWAARLGLGGSAAGRFELRRGDGVWGWACRQQSGHEFVRRGCAPGPTNVALPGGPHDPTDGYGDMKSRFPAPERTLRSAPKRRRSRWGGPWRSALLRWARAANRAHRTPSTRARDDHLRPLLLLDALLGALLLHRCRVQQRLQQFNPSLFLVGRVVHEPDHRPVLGAQVEERLPLQRTELRF